MVGDAVGWEIVAVPGATFVADAISIFAEA
jgi:hypothetical protein